MSFNQRPFLPGLGGIPRAGVAVGREMEHIKASLSRFLPLSHIDQAAEGHVLLKP